MLPTVNYILKLSNGEYVADILDNQHLMKKDGKLVTIIKSVLTDHTYPKVFRAMGYKDYRKHIQDRANQIAEIKGLEVEIIYV